MKKKLLIYLPLLLLSNLINAQKQPFESPKLVVGVVVDQMRFEYINRFWDEYGNGGFKKLIKKGFNCKNTHFNYVPTYTGPGHASIYTGTTPKRHGIIANNWYDKKLKKSVYCTSDNKILPIGTQVKGGKMSPHRMKTTTIGDALNLYHQNKSKVIGIALKDRGAILPAGHTADAAYWFIGKEEGNWVSSSHYLNELPNWVKNFNSSRRIDNYKKDWNFLYPKSTYAKSREDNNSFEGKFKGEFSTTLPHKLPQLWEDNKKYSILKNTPYGNSLTADFAISAIDGEQLGKDNITDLLAISFSSTDYVGHQFGVNSKEIHDTYLRLDKDIERLLDALDDKVGENNYTLFLTADHGASYAGSYLQSLKIPANYMDYDVFTKELKEYMTEIYGTDRLIENVSNNQIFLNHDMIKQMSNIPLSVIEQKITNWVLAYDKVQEVYTATQIKQNNYTKNTSNLLQNGFNHKRSGDIIIVLDNDVVSYSKTGSTHGSGFSYDTQVPLLFYGRGINKGETFKRTEIIDIASTITSLLGIPQTSGCTGNPIEEVIKIK